MVVCAHQCCFPSDCLPVCSKTLSQRVSVYSKKLVGEQDALAVEVGAAQKA